MTFKRAPIIYNLLFVDDNFLVFKTDDREVIMVKEVVESYVKALGQQVNLAKIFYSFFEEFGEFYSSSYL